MEQFGRTGRGGNDRGMTGGMRRGGRAPRPQRRGNDEKEVWIPVTNLGRLVKAGAIKSIEEIYLHSLAIKESQIVDHFFGRNPMPGQQIDVEKSDLPILKDEVMSVSPVQKQSASGQRTRFRALVIVGDSDGHFGFGAKVAKETATAIRGAIIAAKLSLIPVRRGYWGNHLGHPHTVPITVSAKCASVKGRLIPAPRGTGVVGSPVAKKVLTFAGVHDCFTQSSGHTRTTGNFIRAFYRCLSKTYNFLTPDLWCHGGITPGPFDEHAKALEKCIDKPEEVVAGAE